MSGWVSLPLNPSYADSLKRPVACLYGVGVDVHLAAHLPEFFRHLRHAAFLFVQRCGVVAHVLGVLHRAEFRAALGPEWGTLVRLLGQRLSMKVFGGSRAGGALDLVLQAQSE